MDWHNREREKYICSSDLGLIRLKIDTLQEIETTETTERNSIASWIRHVVNSLLGVSDILTGMAYCAAYQPIACLSRGQGRRISKLLCALVMARAAGLVNTLAGQPVYIGYPLTVRG